MACRIGVSVTSLGRTCVSTISSRARAKSMISPFAPRLSRPARRGKRVISRKAAPSGTDSMTNSVCAHVEVEMVGVGAVIVGGEDALEYPAAAIADLMQERALGRRRAPGLQ